MDWKDKTKLPEAYIGKIENLVKEEDTKFTGGQDKISELVESLDEWMTGCNCKWPTSLKGQPRGKAWAKDTKRRLAMEYLGLRKGIISPIETLKKLDVLFQCQGDLPSKLNQGTVLINPDGIYLICITPTCDCSRPHRIKNCYVFLEAHQEDISTLGDHPEGTVVAIRTKENGNLKLVVSLKPTYTYKISNPSLNGDLIASLTYGSEDTFVIKPVAQLRPSRIQSLISQATGKAIEVGLDRSEILRQLCKSN